MKRISTQKAQTITEVTLSTDQDITFEEFIAIAKYHAQIKFSPGYEKRISDCRSLIEQFLEEKKAVYGVTTGFGDNVRYTISPEDATTLQKNILRSHACSIGDPLIEEEIRSILLMIILNTGKGHSGIKLDTLHLLGQFLNQNLISFAPKEGSVGYLSVEAHICLPLIGEGFFLKDNKKIPGSELLKAHHLTPVQLGCKEGLLLISGTTSVTALALLSLYHGLVAEKNIEIANTLTFEALRATTKALDLPIHQLKKHDFQIIAAENMNWILQGSQICETYRDTKVQDACLLRTMPQIMGACKQLIYEAYETIINEMHSVSDNPVLFLSETELGSVAMTGNFDATFVGTHCDMLAIAFANLANLVERATDRMVNHHLSDGLPPFLITNPGLNNGFMIPQYTQAALASKLKLLATPASIDSITTCAGQEDPVSMAYSSASKANESAKLLETMAAIQLFTAAQALEYIIISSKLAPSPITEKVLKKCRTQVAYLEEDRYLYEDIEAFTNIVNLQELIRIVETDLNIIL